MLKPSPPRQGSNSPPAPREPKYGLVPPPTPRPTAGPPRSGRQVPKPAPSAAQAAERREIHGKSVNGVSRGGKQQKDKESWKGGGSRGWGGPEPCHSPHTARCCCQR